MSKVGVVLCTVCLLVSAPVWGADVSWSYAGSGNWATGSNWSTGSPPTADQIVDLPDTVGGAGYTVTIDQPGAVCAGIEINLTNSTLLLTDGGDFTVNGCMTSYATPNTATGGVFKQTGGTSHISGFRNARWGNNGGKPAEIIISGGTMLPAYLTNDDGKIIDCGYRSGSSPNRGGILHIIGSEASITMLGGEEASGYGAFQLLDYGVVIFELDENGVSPINVDLTKSADLLYPKGDNADLAGGIIDIRGVAPPLGTSITLLTADVIDSTGVSLDPSDVEGGSEWGDNYWTLTIIPGSESGAGNPNNGDNGSVIVTYVPEPTTLSLLVISGIGVLLRRRRQ